MFDAGASDGDAVRQQFTVKAHLHRPVLRGHPLADDVVGDLLRYLRHRISVFDSDEQGDEITVKDSLHKVHFFPPILIAPIFLLFF